ncbi:MAG: ferritin-like domain-containing protein [Sandaracinaceae bacterium]|nr:ferritin-like domain-containing protein [Sandaracinaceae bacterium]
MGIKDLGDVLRSIARGRSFALARGLVVAGSLACSGCSGGCAQCGGPIVLVRELTDEQRAALADADSARRYQACQNLCGYGNLEGTWPGDVGMADAGTIYGSYFFSWTCEEEPPNVRCTAYSSCGEGRAPQALRPRGRTRARTRLGEHFASVAHLESAAVPAFFELASELALHGAPRSMSRAARRSARQEITHARLVGRLAGRFGGEVPVVERGETAPRSLFEMAKDNAFEGCVREASGALLAAHQAAHARDPEVRWTFAQIARDEAQHALLSLALHDWARSRFTDVECRLLDETREAGIASLRVVLSAEEPDAALSIAGLPSATRANDLVNALGA